MKKLIQFLAVMSIFVSSMAYAQRPFSDLRNDAVAQEQTDTPSQVSPSDNPERRLYPQERKKDQDSKQAIRRRAELKAFQRRDRISTMKWLGISKSRPTFYNAPFNKFSGYGRYHTNWNVHWGSPSVVVYVDR